MSKEGFVTLALYYHNTSNSTVLISTRMLNQPSINVIMKQTSQRIEKSNKGLKDLPTNVMKILCTLI